MTRALNTEFVNQGLTTKIMIPARSIATLVVDLKDPFQKGDVNKDGQVDVSDVTTLINLILH